jgi:hypothetical protein
MKLDLVCSSIRCRPPNRCLNSLIVCPLLFLVLELDSHFPGIWNRVLPVHYHS